MFCKVKGFESLGAGKVIDQVGSACLVEYFSSPVEAKREVKRVPIGSILRYRLGANTRIYYLDSMTGHWLVGRVIEDTGYGWFASPTKWTPPAITPTFSRAASE